MTASLGIGAALLPFAINRLIEVSGISSTCLYFEFSSGIFIPVCAAFTDKCPEHLQIASPLCHPVPNVPALKLTGLEC